MQPPCSYLTKTGTHCKAPALIDSDPPGCINHDLRLKTKGLKRAAVRKGGQKVWANQRAKSQEVISRAKRMEPLLESIESNHNLSGEESAMLKAAIDEVMRSTRSADANRSLNLVALMMGMLNTKKEPVQAPTDQELISRVNSALESTGKKFCCHE